MFYVNTVVRRPGRVDILKYNIRELYIKCYVLYQRNCLLPGDIRNALSYIREFFVSIKALIPANRLISACSCFGRTAGTISTAAPPKK